MNSRVLSGQQTGVSQSHCRAMIIAWLGADHLITGGGGGGGVEENLKINKIFFILLKINKMFSTLLKINKLFLDMSKKNKMLCPPQKKCFLLN